ncbi:AraC family transcriptional regulator [Marinobacter sp. 1Y8]
MKDFARASALTGYGEVARQSDLNPREMLLGAGLPEDTLESPDGLVSYRRFLALLNESALRSGDPLFGLKLGLHQGISIFGPLLYLIRNADNVSEALLALRHYFHLHMGAAQLDFEPYGSMMQLSYNVLNPLQTGLNQGVELAMGVGSRLLRALLGQQWQPKAILLQHSPQASTADYERLLGSRLQFNAPTNALLIDIKDLETPLANADPQLHRLIRAHLDNMQQLTDHELPDYVASLLRNMLAQGRVTVGQIAECMAMSQRTLQRRLAERGTSFQAILDDTRQGLARRYLSDSSLQMTQLADLLGYGDLSAFSRAFTRWFGVAPTTWQHNAAPSKEAT